MALKFIRYGNGEQQPAAQKAVGSSQQQVPQPQQQSQPQENDSSNWLKDLLLSASGHQAGGALKEGPDSRFAVSGVKSLETPFHLLNVLSRLAGGPNLQTSNLPSEDLSKFLLPEGTSNSALSEFVIDELPFILASGGFRSFPALAQSAATSLGIHGGSKLGSSVGGAIGQALGDEERGQILGGLAGGIGGSALTHGAINRPSRELAPKLQAAEQAAFEQGKAGRLAQVGEEFAPRFKDQAKAFKEATLALPREKSAFQKAQKNAINIVRSEVTNYKNKIKDLNDSRKVFYDNASKLEGKTKANADSIIKTVKDVRKELPKGISLGDRRSISSNLNSLSKAIKKGELSVSNAKKFQKNFNDQIYNFGSSNSFKRQMNEVTQSLNEFIRNNGTPEHNVNWQKAEQATRELKALEKNERAFNKQKNQEIRDINKEKFSPEKEVLLKGTQKEAQQALKLTRDEYNRATKAIGKENYEDFIKSQQKQETAANVLGSFIDKLPSKYGPAGIGAALGYMGFDKLGALSGGLLGKFAGALTGKLGNEINIVKEAFNKNPKLFDEWAKLIIDSTKQDASKIAFRANNLVKKLEKEIPEKKYKVLYR